MKCPRTRTELKPVKVGGITVDISEACGGVFFDNTELSQFDEKAEKRGSALTKHLKQFVPPKLDLSQRVNCPKCCKVVMARHFYSPKNKIEIDECPSCGGVWFDYGELEKLHNLFPTKEDRERASQEFDKQMTRKSSYQSTKNNFSLDRRRQSLFFSFIMDEIYW